MRLIAAMALVDIRTVRRFFAGQRVYGLPRERIEKAVSDLDAAKAKEAG